MYVWDDLLNGAGQRALLHDSSFDQPLDMYLWGSGETIAFKRVQARQPSMHHDIVYKILIYLSIYPSIYLHLYIYIWSDMILFHFTSLDSLKPGYFRD